MEQIVSPQQPGRTHSSTTPCAQRLSGAELVIRLLEQQGVTCIAGIPGGANLPLYDALSHSKIIRHVLARHEQGAGFIAQGMSRVSGRPSVFFATSGPGATNILTALADAKLDSVPIIAITGQVPLSMIGTDAFQEVDIYGMSIPVTKHNFLVRSVDELLRVIPEAFAIAATGRPGPVLIDIPKNVQTAIIEVADLPEPGRAEAPIEPDFDILCQAADLINAAKSPLLLLGGGAASPEAANRLRELIDRHRLPVAQSLLGLGVFPTGHELSLGMIGMHGARYANLIVEEADLLVVVGSRFSDRLTGRIDKFSPGAKVIHVDVDPSEVNKLRSAHLGIVADAGCFFEALAPLLRCVDRLPWLSRIAELKRQNLPCLPHADDPCSAYGIVRQTAALLDGTAVITTDVGQHQMRVAQAYPFAYPRQWLTSGGLGTMGFGLPAAVGAALQNPKATVVCFTSDGSLLMNLQEMATAVEQNANVKILLCNNRGLGLVQQQQSLFYGGRLFGSSFETDVDFLRIAEGFGMPAFNLNSSGSPMEDLRNALRTPGPALIEIRISVDDKVFPMVPPGAANSDMIGAENHA